VQLAQAAAQNSGSGSPPPAQQAGPSANAATGAEAGGAPGQMSEEDARELLDSAKSEERHSLPVPSGPRDPDHPDKPFKNW
jgi:hypothetical protein